MSKKKSNQSYVCGKCKELKCSSLFHRRKQSKNGLNSWCKVCSNKVRKDPKYSEYDRKRQRLKHEGRRQKMLEYLEGKCCVDCEEDNFMVLTFDHISNKHKGISEMIKGYSWEKILIEIRKCKIRCANCHMIRTAKQQKSYKYKHYLKLKRKASNRT